MNNKKDAVWLIAGGPMQKPAAALIKAQGYALIISDGSEDCACRPDADYFIHADTFSPAQNSAAIEAIRAHYNVKAVFTCGADCHETVAILAAQLGCHGIDPAISHLCRHKHLTRQVLTDAGLPQPQFGVAESLSEAQAIVQRLGGSAVIKATDNSASRGLSMVSPEKPLLAEQLELAKFFGTTNLALIEEVIRPTETECAEQSVETFWINGRMFWLNWVDRIFRKDLQHFSGFQSTLSYDNLGWGVEIGHVNPARHAPAVQATIAAAIERAGMALGMGRQKGGHILKADIMLTDKGPVILEMTPRLSGGWDSGFSTPARGANFIAGALAMALGETDADHLLAHYFTFKEGLHAAVLATIPADAENCVGRLFAGGSGHSAEDALQTAQQQLLQHSFI
jgi:biotin carboxylase